jgi:hypothetical protein
MLKMKFVAAIFILLLTVKSGLFAQNTIEWVIPLDAYQIIHPWSDYFLIMQNGKYGIVDKNLQTVVEPRFSQIYVLNDWALGAFEDRKWGFLHAGNPRQWALEPLYTDKGGWSKTALSREEANIRHQVKEYTWIGDLNGKAITVSADKAGVSVVEWVEEPVIMNDGYLPSGSTHKRPKLNTKPWYKAWQSVTYLVDPFSDDQWGHSSIVRYDVYQVEENNHYGIIDSSGKVLLPAKHFTIDEVNLNTICVRVDTGKALAPVHALFRLPDCKRMSKGVYWHVQAAGPNLDSPIIVGPYQGTRYGLLSPAGEEWIPCEYEAFGKNGPPNFIPARKNGQWGLIDMKNRVLLPFEYNLVTTASSDPSTDVYVSKNGRMGVLRVK